MPSFRIEVPRMLAMDNIHRHAIVMRRLPVLGLAIALHEGARLLRFIAYHALRIHGHPKAVHALYEEPYKLQYFRVRPFHIGALLLLFIANGPEKTRVHHITQRAIVVSHQQPRARGRCRPCLSAHLYRALVHPHRRPRRPRLARHRDHPPASRGSSPDHAPD